MDRVCCERTPSRRGEGGTQPHRSAWGACALAWELAEPRRKGQRTAAAGGSRASAQEGSEGADRERTAHCRPGDPPGDSRHRPSAPTVRPGQGAAPGEVRDTRPGLARSH